MKLEKTARQVTDLFSGKVIAENAKEFTLASETPHTWVLEVR